MEESWIDKSVVLDFPIPKDVRYELDLCEELNDKHDYIYFAWAEGLDSICKEAVRQNHLTQKQ